MRKTPIAVQTMRGFTLIEVLIVMLIVGIIATFATLSVSDWGASRKVENTRSALTLLFTAAQHQAVLQPAELGLMFTEQGFAGYQRIYNSRLQRYQWKALDRASGLAFYEISSDVNIELVINNRVISPLKTTKGGQPQLIFSSSGTMTPFILFLGEDDAPPVVRMTGLYDGQLKIEDLALGLNAEGIQ